MLLLTFVLRFMPTETISRAISSIKDAYLNRIVSTKSGFFGGLAQ